MYVDCITATIVSYICLLPWVLFWNCSGIRFELSTAAVPLSPFIWLWFVLNYIPFVKGLAFQSLRREMRVKRSSAQTGLSPRFHMGNLFQIANIPFNLCWKYRCIYYCPSDFLQKHWHAFWYLCLFKLSFMFGRYLVTHLMGADLNNIVKCQKLTDDHVQFLIYQILRGLKVSLLNKCVKTAKNACFLAKS